MARIPEADIERLRVNLGAAPGRIIRHRVEEGRQGLAGLLPFHEDTRQSGGDATRICGNCFGCGIGGGPIDWSSAKTASVSAMPSSFLNRSFFSRSPGQVPSSIRRCARCRCRWIATPTTCNS